jgi:hypothetical protein
LEKRVHDSVPFSDRGILTDELPSIDRRHAFGLDRVSGTESELVAQAIAHGGGDMDAGAVALGEFFGHGYGLAPEVVEELAAAGDSADHGAEMDADGNGTKTLHDLASEYGISAERVRQIETAALKKMRSLLQAQAA